MVLFFILGEDMWDSLWLNANIATCDNALGNLKKGSLAVAQGKIAWVGTELPDAPESLAKEVFDVEGQCITPGLIDCHSHVVFAGNRAHEFEMRLQGASYESIALAGGGIQGTVQHTRHLSEEELLTQSLPRLEALMSSGVTTIEIKSGYGLDLASELKMLRVANSIGEMLPIHVMTTFLGAHTIPKEFHGKADEYIDFVCHEMLPAVAAEKLADHVDVFCEKIAFNLAQTERVFKTAKEFDLGIKCHSEQLSDLGSAKLAAQYKALSVDHLEYLSEEGVAALAKSGTVAVLLPGAFYFLREKQLPPIDLLRSANVPMAIASDCNPGTSPIASLLLVLNMACTVFRMTPQEALLGVTVNAAKALGLQDRKGKLAIGMDADFIVWDVKDCAELCYWMGLPLMSERIYGGESL